MSLKLYDPFGTIAQEWRITGTYRYSFNGKESDSEWDGGGAMFDYGFRIYDPRLGRFLSVDPLTGEYPYYTPYQFAGNTPIQSIDLDGLEPAAVSGKKPAVTSYIQQGRSYQPRYSENTTANDATGGGYGGARGRQLENNFYYQNVAQPQIAQIQSQKAYQANQSFIGTDPNLPGTAAQRVAARERQQMIAAFQDAYAGSLIQGLHIGTSLLGGEIAFAKGLQVTMNAYTRGASFVDGYRKIQVYRGTANFLENTVHTNTNYLMSDAARIGYGEGGNSIQAGLSRSQNAHNQWVQVFWGSEDAYVQAHGLWGSELSNAFGIDRSMISVTTDINVAKNFAGSQGTVYSGFIRKKDLLKQTLPGSGESEYLIKHMTNKLQVNPKP